MEKSIGMSNMAEIGHILGIDFGQAKIGLAIADSETRMAFAFDMLPNSKDFWKKLGEIIEKKNVKSIIVGIPTYKNLPNQKLEKKRGRVIIQDLESEIKKFGEEIRKKFNVEVEFQDEMFTTKMAEENIKERGGRNIAEKDDQEAARIILQSWLDRQA